MWWSQVLASAAGLPSVLLPLLLPLPLFVNHSLGYTPLSDASLRSLTVPKDAFDIHNKESGLLAPILIPRVSGTEGNRQVQKFFLDFFARELPLWNVTTQTSHSKTPATGDRELPFTNIIAWRDPPWAAPGDTSYLTLAAHFDSKYTPHDFIGATDSAAPCAMMLHAARELDAALTAKWAAASAAGVDEFEAPQGVQLLLLDGEEAFVTWSHTDSLYGARALAEEWEKPGGSMFGAAANTGGEFSNRLSTISLFVLLDLLGAAMPYAKVPSYFRTTHWAYQAMAKVEGKLRGLGVWASKAPDRFLHEEAKSENDDTVRWLGGMVEDDHLPFMARGVEILHLIASPFPRVWHTMEDDGEHLDIPTVEDWARLVTAFTAEWMDLEGHLGKSAQGKRDTSGDKSELS